MIKWRDTVVNWSRVFERTWTDFNPYFTDSLKVGTNMTGVRNLWCHELYARRLTRARFISQSTLKQTWLTTRLSVALSLHDCCQCLSCVIRNHFIIYSCCSLNTKVSRRHVQISVSCCVLPVVAMNSPATGSHSPLPVMLLNSSRFPLEYTSRRSSSVPTVCGSSRLGVNPTFGGDATCVLWRSIALMSRVCSIKEWGHTWVRRLPWTVAENQHFNRTCYCFDQDIDIGLSCDSCLCTHLMLCSY